MTDPLPPRDRALFEIDLVTMLLLWRDDVANSEQERGRALFMGKPDAWYEDPHWFCINGHVSGRYLSTETRGERCLACGAPVILGPPIGEAAFAPILADLRAELEAKD
ncbi:MAG TPA: hypothetical protein VFW22_16365 [Pseudolabrys sp.]|nr:hypothetical protein [Pseudolabrys sp.]